MTHSTIRGSALVLFLIALVLAVSGQLAFNQGPDEGLSMGLLLYGCSALSLLAAFSVSPVPDPAAHIKDVTTPPPSQPHKRQPLAALLLVLGSLAVVYAALVSAERARELPRYDLLLVWVLGLCAVMAAFGAWSGLHPLERLRPIRLPQPEQALMLALVAVTFLLRVIDLEHIPYVLSGDEASMGLEAVKVLRGSLSNPFTTGWLSHPTLYFFMQSVALGLGGISTAALRWSSALCAALSVLWLYKLSRRWYGRRVAFIAALMYAGWHYAIHYGRIGLNNIWDPFFALGVLWHAQRGLDEGRWWPWAVSGLLLGLCIYSYMGARLIPFILLMFLLLRWAQGAPLWRRYRRHILVCALLAVLAALPLLVYYMKHWSDLMARWSAVGIVPSGWLANEAVITGKTEAQLLIQQLRKAFLAFNLYPDPTYHYMPGI
ncbi:MAG: glycosyltransferase family 39 protein, partial [Chloroflexi bacterium]|nr:glycosyltransferase family 39 protein [Chloroflexota bacterium]